MLRFSMLVLVAGLACGGPAGAEPGLHWQTSPSPDTPFATSVAHGLDVYAGARQPTALMVVQDDRVIAQWGDVARRVNVRSVRKSLLSALYGIAVSERRIMLGATLTELGIDDTPPVLTAAEKRATVRDLLMARSGVYHPAAYETADIRKRRPERGSHEPGSFWFYNNWDFNVLATIFCNATGKDIFASFARQVAEPIGMEDFSDRDGSYVREPVSLHPAYPFRLSARDLARFGLLYLNHGQWNGRQVIPASWVEASTTPYSWTRRGRLGYGYLWWILPSDPWGPNAIMASGYGGQFLAVIPAKRLVVVETVDLQRNPRGIHTSAFLDMLKPIVEAAPAPP